MKRYVILAVCFIVLVAVSGFAVDRYNSRVKPTPVPTTAQAVAAQKASDRAVLAQHDTASATMQQSLMTMTANRNAVCTQLKTVKLTNPACN